MPEQSYYELLGVGKDATPKEIKRAFRSKAKKYHPDINSDPGAEEQFKKYAEAYDVLSDPQKRQNYDQFGKNGAQGGFGGAGFDFSNFDFGDIFGDIFGGAFGRGSRHTKKGPRRGQDVFLRMNVKFESAVFGEDVDIKVDTQETCPKCNGKGAQKDSDIRTCSSCHGNGIEIVNQKTMFGVMQSQVTCRTCHGEGEEILKACSKCKGIGHNDVIKTITLTIPAGIQSGNQLRIAGKGYAGTKGASNGDLYVEILVQDHPKFTRSGHNIHIEVPISSFDAMLGTTIDIPTMYGDIELKIPAGIQYGTKLKIPKKGILSSHHKGDQIVTIIIKTSKLTSKQEKLVKEAKEKTKDTIFSKFKKMF